MNIERREFLRLISFASAYLTGAHLFAQEVIRLKVTLFEHKSDFDLPSEFTTRAPTFRFDDPPPKDLERYQKIPAEQMAREILRIAVGHASRKINRKDNRPEITEFLNTVGETFIYKGTPVPFCAAGISFAACEAFCILSRISYSPASRVKFFRKTILPLINYYYFYPTSCVPEMKSKSVSRRSWIKEEAGVKPQKGWFVVFSFLADGKPSHIGIVDTATEKVLQTVEYNTRRSDDGNQRDGGSVWGPLSRIVRSPVTLRHEIRDIDPYVSEDAVVSRTLLSCNRTRFRGQTFSLLETSFSLLF